MATEAEAAARTALVGARVFDGNRIRNGTSVLIDGDRIAAVVSDGDVPSDYQRQDVSGLIAPGFVDIQVNGGGGVMFNDHRTIEGIAAIGTAHRPYGTTGFLPTLITDTPDVMAEAIAAVQDALARGVPGLLGVHIEGPFLNPVRKGAHREDYIRPITEDDIVAIAADSRGATMLTLAPEMVPVDAVRRLADAGVLLAAGHTKATYDEIQAARRAGLTAFTHLFNAMPPLTGREPGPVGAALDDPQAWCSVIVDLHHVSAPSLRVAIAARGWDRTILVTDAMASVGSPDDAFDLHGRTISRSGGRLTMADGTLAGSDLDMATAVRNCVEELRLPLEAALHMASQAPAEFLGLGNELGQVTPGFRASLVLLNDALQVRETWISGRSSAQIDAVNA
ncbi:N-acetylglucosamine-6-phosphate deacetylase [Bauldia sp.]|uniref:N-acetylglucosamine-6-phosphate deacetylase n=1 Tax=Bauldia sp. TaxID=2575872 RepID=UPI003BA902D3